MKNFKVLAVALIMFFIVGCAGFQINTNNVCLTAGNALGIYVASKVPAQAPLILQNAQGLLTAIDAGTVTAADFQSDINLLLGQGNIDPALQLLVTVALDSISVSWTPGTVNADAENVIKGFIQGLQSVKTIKAKKALRK
jgi:hypothetical protein